MSTGVMNTHRRVEIDPFGAIGVNESPLRELSAGEARVAIAYVGICGSDLHALDDMLADPTAPGARRTLGHEQSGVVVEVANGVRAVAVGDRVSVLPRMPCGVCSLCRRGKESNCQHMRRPDAGGWAETMTVNTDFLVRVPDSLSLREAALAEPTACVLRAIDRAEIQPGDTALVVGAGPMGLLLVQLLPLCGVATVLVSEPNAQRRALAESFGAVVCDPTTDNPADWVRSVTDGRGVEIAFEVAGFAVTLEQSIDAAAVGGTVVVVGVASPSAVASVRPRVLFEKELTIRGAWGIETTFSRALAFLDRIDAAALISEVFELERADEAIAAARGGSPGKVLIRPNEGLALL